MVSFDTKKDSLVHHLAIDSESSGQRLDNFLFTYLKGVPKSRIYRIIRKGEIRINKKRVKPDYKLCPGDDLRIPPLRLGEEKPPITCIPSNVEKSLLDQILYEDNDLLVMNKPAGIAVHGGSGLSFGVIEALRILKPEIKSLELIHRLDKETSGCLLIAKRRSALRFMHEEMRSGRIEKNYLALVKGKWQAGKVVDLPLIKNQLSGGERIVRVSELGKPSRTEFKVLKMLAAEQQCGPISLMEVHLVTGRTHQIRVHAEHVGHPIAGDLKYGDNDFNRFMKTKGLSRLFLHANRITIPLPKTGQLMSIEAPLDNNLTAVLENL